MFANHLPWRFYVSVVDDKQRAGWEWDEASRLFFEPFRAGFGTAHWNAAEFAPYCTVV
jgi:hypothetical protein